MSVAVAHSPDAGKPEAAAGMTGRVFMQAMIDGKIPPPSIAQTLSFRLVEIGDGLAVFEGETGPHLLNPLGTVHGGWVLALIDSATGCAAHATLPAGFGITTIETKVNFTRPISKDTGRVRTEGRVVVRGRQIITAEARVLDVRARPGARHLDHHGDCKQGRRRSVHRIGVSARRSSPSEDLIEFEINARRLAFSRADDDLPRDPRVAGRAGLKERRAPEVVA
jgi:uncharacterized protein (TIGR00369 family)